MSGLRFHIDKERLKAMLDEEYEKQKKCEANGHEIEWRYTPSLYRFKTNKAYGRCKLCGAEFERYANMEESKENSKLLELIFNI